MIRQPRDFSARSRAEQEFLTENSWCEDCGKADIGILEPVEYEEEGKIFVEGSCVVCGAVIRSEITERDISDE